MAKRFRIKGKFVSRLKFRRVRAAGRYQNDLRAIKKSKGVSHLTAQRLYRQSVDILDLPRSKISRDSIVDVAKKIEAPPPDKAAPPASVRFDDLRDILTNNIGRRLVIDTSFHSRNLDEIRTDNIPDIMRRLSNGGNAYFNRSDNTPKDLPPDPKAPNRRRWREKRYWRVSIVFTLIESPKEKRISWRA